MFSICGPQQASPGSSGAIARIWIPGPAPPISGQEAQAAAFLVCSLGETLWAHALVFIHKAVTLAMR